METAVIYADRNTRSTYEALVSMTCRIQFVPLDPTPISLYDACVGLAIIDCGQDAETGLSHLAEIKRQRPDVPVIFITDVHSGDVVLQAHKLGAREYFRKPFPPDEFSAAMEKLLRFKRQSSACRPSAFLESLPPQPVELQSVLPERLQRVIEYIIQNLSAPLPLEDLAKEACMSKYHFCRYFKSHMGMSPKQYCIFSRMGKARQLLCNPDQSVTQTSLRLGFNNLNDFTRHFKKFTGLTPRAFQNALCRMSQQDSNFP